MELQYLNSPWQQVNKEQCLHMSVLTTRLIYKNKKQKWQDHSQLSNIF